MVNWQSQSKNPPQSPEEGHIYCILLICIAFCQCLKTCHFAACFTSLWTCISVFYVNTARDVITVLLIFAKYLSLYLHVFTCTYRGSHTQAHMYNQHTRGMATTRRRSLIERGGRKALLETLHAKKQYQEKTDIHESKNTKIRAHRASSKATRLFLKKQSKLLDYFVRSNQSNINQSH